MDPLKKNNLLKYAKNEYLGAVLAAKVARRLHAMQPDQRPDADAKCTSLALKLITDGEVKYEIVEIEEPAVEETDDK
ncbi:MAG: hypothetical protein U9Q95_05800 [Candidatus Eisenbacteria bacterium]|nr:hypothetical protein [Candidatus Eisenbacteria bacterium]